MADIHGVPDASMMTPVQGFTSEPLPDVTAQFDAANSLAAPGGPRQQATERLLYSPPGFSAGSGTSGYDIPEGWTGEPDESFVNNAQPTMTLETPIQGAGDYPGTVQDGLPVYGM